MPATYTCDKCGASAPYQDYDGVILCEPHRAEKDLDFARYEYRERFSWVKTVYIQELIDKRAEIRKLEEIVAANQKRP